MGSIKSVCDHESRIAYHNGQWVDAANVQISATDPAMTQAVIAVERLRAYQNDLFQQDRHLDRWERTINALAIDGLPSRTGILGLFSELIGRNRAWIRTQEHFGVVMFASPGVGGIPTLVIDLYAIDDAMLAARIARGTPIVVTSIQQPPNACWPRNIKVRCRLHYYLADREACSIDPDAIGILVDADATITESSVANLVLVEGDRLISPPSDQLLNGVTLQVVRDLAADAGIKWQEERIPLPRLSAADEVLLTGTSCGLWYARSVDGSIVKSAGPVYRKLRMAFDALVSRDA